jgi:uncharacterized membrane protein YgcG
MKKLLILTLCLMLFVGMIPPASATDTPKIVDEYDLLTTEQEEDLEEKARKIVDKYDMDVVIVTVWSLGGKSAEAYADDYFDYNGYGIGEDYSGCLFLLSMEYRDWAISTCGDSIYALTDYGIEQLFESCKDYLSDDRYTKPLMCIWISWITISGLTKTEAPSTVITTAMWMITSSTTPMILTVLSIISASLAPSTSSVSLRWVW